MEKYGEDSGKMYINATLMTALTLWLEYRKKSIQVNQKVYNSLMISVVVVMALNAYKAYSYGKNPGKKRNDQDFVYYGIYVTQLILFLSYIGVEV